MNATQIERRIIEATGATNVRVSGDGSDGYWMADFHSPNGGRILNAQFEAAGFQQESLLYNGGGEWTAGLFAPQPGDGLPESHPPEGGDVLADEQPWRVWKLSPDSDPQEHCVIVTDDGEREITGIVYEQADAERIITAVNGYDALRAAVHALRHDFTPEALAALWALVGA